MNFKIRFKDPHFWVQLLGIVLFGMLSYHGLAGEEVTSWTYLFSLFGKTITNPYLVFTLGMSIYNAFRDPTTSGTFDSDQAMGYDEVKQNVD